MLTKEAERSLKCLDVLMHRRDERGLITPPATGMLQALGDGPQAGVALGQALSLLDYVCLEAGVPLLGQLIYSFCFRTRMVRGMGRGPGGGPTGDFLHVHPAHNMARQPSSDGPQFA